MNTPVSRSEVKALTARQERKLVEFMENMFLETNRAFKKRSQSTSRLQTLSSYLDATREILAMIIQIPPVGPSASLRTTFLLRLTGDALLSIPGYPATPGTLPNLLDWLDDVDQAWVVVLKAQVWDRESGTGVDLPVRNFDDHGVGELGKTVNVTEKTRLHSLIVGGEAALEEWLAGVVSEDEGGLLQDCFNDLFSGTLEALGVLEGVVQRPERNEMDFDD